MSYLFITPTVEQGPIGLERLFQFYTYHVGVTVLKFGNQYVEVMYPNEDDLALADKVYLGGYDNIVSNEEAAALTAAGYGNYLEEIV